MGAISNGGLNGNASEASFHQTQLDRRGFLLLDQKASPMKWIQLRSSIKSLRASFGCVGRIKRVRKKGRKCRCVGMFVCQNSYVNTTIYANDFRVGLYNVQMMFTPVSSPVRHSL